MELEKFCPRCGEEVDRLYGEEKKLCADCYPDKNRLLDIPQQVDIVICSVCGRTRIQGDWLEEYSLKDQLSVRFAEFSEEDVEMHLQYWEVEDEIKVRVHAEKGEIEASYDTEVEFQRQQCPECAKFRGGFYKVKMQLRGDELEGMKNDILDESSHMTDNNRKDFLSDMERVDHGYNLYISTERMAKKILSMLRSRFDPEIKRSYELLGEEDGQEVYRNVISVRKE